MDSGYTSDKTRKGFLFEPLKDDDDYEEVIEPMCEELHSEETLPDDSRMHNMIWCICDNCQHMPTNVENVCCKEIEPVRAKLVSDHSCITNTEAFHTMCLNNDVLEMLTLALRNVIGNSSSVTLTNRYHDIYTVFSGV